MDYLAIAFFAFIGGNLRFLTGEWLPKVNGFPVSTLVVNLIGCFLFAYLIKRVLVFHEYNGRFILGMGTGLIGSLTTFSSFALDFNTLILNHQLNIALLYGGLSMLGGLAAVLIGSLLPIRGEHKGRASR